MGWHQAYVTVAYLPQIGAGRHRLMLPFLPAVPKLQSHAGITPHQQGRRMLAAANKH